MKTANLRVPLLQVETLYTLVSAALFLGLCRRLIRQMEKSMGEMMWLEPGEQMAKLYAAQYQRFW